jgi:hypothetical protein
MVILQKVAAPRGFLPKPRSKNIDRFSFLCANVCRASSIFTQSLASYLVGKTLDWSGKPSFSRIIA